MSRFERDTAVTRTADGRYRATIDAGWAVIDGAAANGGYLMALAARAMRDGLDHPDPVTLTAHFLAPPEHGEVDIDVEVVRRGRRHTNVAAAILQGGRERVRLLGVFGDLAQASGPTRIDRQPLPLPPLEECVDTTSQSREQARAGTVAPPPIFQRFEHRQPADQMGWAEGRPTGRGEIGGYVRWPDGTPMDTLGVLVVADCYPPAVFNTGDSRLGWVPTLELTVQLRARPNPAGYLATRFETTAVSGGYLEEDGDIRDADGTLVALSRQLALVAR